MALKFILIKDETGYDISDVVQKVEWAGRKNSPTRTLKLTILDDPELGESNRTGIDVYEGHHLIFLEDGKELFRGIIMVQVRDQERNLEITAYDNGIYLSNNKGSFSYRKKTATAIFMDVCKRYGISRGEAAQTTYKIPELVDVNTTIYDILTNALSKTYTANGERYFILSKEGQLHLLRRKEHVTKLVLETGQEGSEYGNITQYAYGKSIANTKTRLRLISQEGKTVASWFDENLEKKIGIMQDVQVPDDNLSKKKLKQQAIILLNQLKQPQETINLTALGTTEVYTGTAIYLSIPEINIGRVFYVDSDTHTWDGDYHTMKLTLNFASDIEQISESGETETDKSADSSATAEAQQMIKDAATALKAKKAAEKKIINAGKKAEKAADAAEKALKNAEKQMTAYDKNMAKAEKAKTAKAAANAEKAAAKNLANASKYAKQAQAQADTAAAQNEIAKTAFAEAKALLGISQSTITSNAEFAVQQADSSNRRAAAAAEAATQYL